MNTHIHKHYSSTEYPYSLSLDFLGAFAGNDDVDFVVDDGREQNK